MSDNQNFGFGQFVPGFDFLQNLAKGASQTLPQMPNLSNWIAPTLNLEELEKRIGELKAVHFWLDQNSKALGATIQALELQKMTLATLKGMNFNMGDVADALKLKPANTLFGASAKATEEAPDAGEDEAVAASKGRASRKTAAKPADTPASVVDPLQWWGALTQQFQEIAANAMKDAAQTADTATNVATAVGKEALKTATGMATSPMGKAGGAGRKATAKRAPRKTAR
jgi:hypothetical protein